VEALVPSCDVFILGGGPAGSTIAALLAERGWDVVIAEKERHPRFHIGESLLPLNLPLLDRLGVREQVERIGLIKHGAEFTTPRAFKCVYYLNNLAHPWRSFKAWRGRKRAIRNLQDESPAHA